MGGLNLEIFKQFSFYVMFPIGFMYYFGTNLDDRFAVHGFWPTKEQSNQVPKDREEIQAELARLRARRLYLRERRLETEASVAAMRAERGGGGGGGGGNGVEEKRGLSSGEEGRK
ncbi:hypothetical protein GGR56DRAFT_672057 [Xylariaceae sp. FL0804]|nr:hypothetical protein GGR56DRAFT_672057 [Xylariaceae sp. FL0804]